jgi:hypothetical protein
VEALIAESTPTYCLMRSFQHRSLLRVAGWLCVGPFVVIGGFALFALGFGVLAAGMQLLAALLKHAGV